jgi:glycosyltransferase involved in cell wall biosynthesis
MISLVSTILNDKAGAIALFEDLQKQTRFPDEMVVVDGGSNDGTWELLQEYAAKLPFLLRPLQIPGANVSHGRNQAIEHSHGEWIVSTDFGCRLDPRWVEKLVEPYEKDPSVQIVTGSWKIDKSEIDSPAAWAEWTLALGKIGMVATETCLASTRSIAFHQSVWVELGKYPEDLSLAGDDAIFSLWMVSSKKKIAAAPEVLCIWHRFKKLQSYWKEAKRNFLGCGEALFFLNFGIKTGIMTAIEILTLLAIALIPHPVILFAFLLIWSKRIFRWSHAVRFLVDQEKWPLSRALQLLPWIIAFDLGTRWIGIRGYWQGVIQGTWKCRSCRRLMTRLQIPRW